ncbi:hypothetical protein [Geotalea sp. SG265]|uniref:hypothetical protein n=1 Tax=Geotalea sp. SG265 TaxID=2922867 RepID=UPI001FAF9C26|nr:hypothetical protein [Geotalea sp. SG265]
MKGFFICCLLVLSLYSQASAEEDKGLPPEESRLVGETIVKSDSFKKDKKAMRTIDAMVPVLKRLGKGKVVRIEGNFAPSLSKDEKVRKSLNLAKEVEQYLRQKHNLPLDLYIAAQDDIVDKRSHRCVRILVLQTEFSEASL